MRGIRTLASGITVVAVLTLAVGCGGNKPATGAKPSGKAVTSEKEAHAHGAGPHGGCLADWGGGKFHVEFTVDHDKQEATVYVLGSDEKTAAPVTAKDGQLTVSVKGVQNKDSFQVALKAMPQAGDPEGKASRFVGKHEKIGVVQEFEGTISGEVDGKPYTGDFKEEPAEKK